MNIKAYDDNMYSYSGTDEEYAEFLKSVDGKLNEGEAVEDSDLGDTKKINLQDVIDKFRKTAGGIKDVSKKITTEAVNKFEDFKKSRENVSDDVSAPADVHDVHDAHIEENVSKNIANCNLNEVNDILKLTSDKTDTVISQTEQIYEKISDIDINCRDIANTAAENRRKSDSIYEAVEEIRKAVSGINKLNDSIFDLKNAQLNAKNAFEETEKGFKSLKKKCIWGIAIVSVLTFISIVLEIIILLS